MYRSPPDTSEAEIQFVRSDRFSAPARHSPHAPPESSVPAGSLSEERAEAVPRMHHRAGVSTRAVDARLRGSAADHPLQPVGTLRARVSSRSGFQSSVPADNANWRAGAESGPG